LITVAELLRSASTAQVFETFLSALTAVGIKAREWRKGGALYTMLYIVAGVFAGFTLLALGFVESGFLETAKGGWLTLLAYHVYNVMRIPATFASGYVQLSNTGGISYTGGSAFQPGQLRVINPLTGKAYYNTEVVEAPPGSVVTVAVLAAEAGAASSTSAFTVSKLETALPGLSVTNGLAIVGSDAEADPVLRQRCRDKLGTLSGLGPRGAYAYAVRSALRLDGTPVDINRLRVSPSSSTGVVTITVASPTGAPAASDLTAIGLSIEETARPDTAKVVLSGAVPLVFGRTLTVWARRSDGVSAEDIKTLVANELLAAMREYPIGGISKIEGAPGYLYASGLEGMIKAAHPSIFAVDGAGPDQVFAANEVANFVPIISVTLVDIGAT